MENSADLGGCYPPRPSASVDNTLLDLQNSSYPNKPHSITANLVLLRMHDVTIRDKSAKLVRVVRVTVPHLICT